MAIGEAIDTSNLFPQFNKFICQRYYMKGQNYNLSEKIKEKVNKMKGIEFSDFSNNNIELNNSPKNSNDWIAMVISTGKNRLDAQKNASQALKIIGRS